MNRTGGSVLRVSGALAVLAALGLLGCSDEQAPSPEPEPRGSGSAVPTENARLLDSAGSAALRAFSREGDVLELEFDEKVGVLTELAGGDVLIIGPTTKTPNGALVLVEDTVESTDGFAVRGRPAALRDAFEELHLKLDTTLIASPSNETQSAPDLGTSRQALGLAFPFEISAGSGKNSITLDGSLAVDPSIDLNLSIDFAKFQLDELSLSFSAKETLTANLVGRGEKTFEETLSLGSIPFAPITIFLPTPIGAIPIVLTPGIALQAGLRGGIRGDVEASVTQRASFTAGLGYKNGKFGGFSDHDSDFDVEEPTYEASANVKAWAGPKLEVLIYGVVGPFAGVQGFVEASANLEGPPVCVTGTLDAGLTATAGMTFLADYSTTLFEAREELASFDTCSKDANAPRPALTWARTFGRAGSDGERAQAVLQVSDGGYFVLGQSDSFPGTGGFGAATWALRLDALGNVLWQRAYERAEQGLARGAAEVADGFVIAGTQGLIKVDVGGNVMWAKQYATEELLELTSVTATTDGALVLAGTYGTVAQAFAMGVDADGEPSWARKFAGSDFRRVRATKDGGVLLAGSIVQADPDFYLVKLDAAGDIEWQRALNNEFNTAPAGEEPIPASSNDAASDVSERPQGGFVVAGESYGNFPIPMPTPVGYFAAAVLELDERGDLTGAGSKLYRAPADSLYGSAYAVAVRANGSPLVLGRRADTAEQLLVNEDVLLLQNGTFSVFGSEGNDSVYSATLAGVGRGQPLLLTADGGAIVAVTSNSFAPQQQEQIWLLKLSRTASIDSPYRSSTPGAAFSAADATSTELTAGTAAVEVEARPLSAAIQSEVTDLTGTLQ